MLIRLNCWLLGLFIFANPAFANCNIARYMDLGYLYDLRSDLYSELTEFEFERAGMVEQRDLARRNIRDLPVTFSLDGSANAASGLSTVSSELELTYDLNVPLQIAHRRRFEAVEGMYTVHLSNISLRENLYFLQQLLNWKYGQEQLRLIERRLVILQQQIAYLEESDRRGASVATDLSKVRLEVLMQNNKILAVETRMNLAIIPLMLPTTSLLEEVNLSWLPNRDPIFCARMSLEISLAQSNIEIYQIEKEISMWENTTSLSFNASQNLIDPNESPRFGLNFQLNILSPQQRGRAVRGAASNYDQAVRDLYLANYRAEGLLREQTAVEQLLLESISSIDNEIEARKILLRELAIREALGQTVFEQKNTTLLDLIGLEEVRLQSVYDFYTGWLQFLEVRGLEN